MGVEVTVGAAVGAGLGVDVTVGGEVMVGIGVEVTVGTAVGVRLAAGVSWPAGAWEGADDEGSRSPQPKIRTAISRTAAVIILRLPILLIIAITRGFL